MYIYVHIYICMYVWLCVSVCVHNRIHTKHIQTHTHTQMPRLGEPADLLLAKLHELVTTVPCCAITVAATTHRPRMQQLLSRVWCWRVDGAYGTYGPTSRSRGCAPKTRSNAEVLTFYAWLHCLRDGLIHPVCMQEALGFHVAVEIAQSHTPQVKSDWPETSTAWEPSTRQANMVYWEQRTKLAKLLSRFSCIEAPLSTCCYGLCQWGERCNTTWRSVKAVMYISANQCGMFEPAHIYFLRGP